MTLEKMLKILTECKQLDGFGCWWRYFDLYCAFGSPVRVWHAAGCTNCVCAFGYCCLLKIADRASGTHTITMSLEN